MKLELRIDRLVLDAALLDGARSDAVAAAIQSELVRLLASPGAVDALRGLGAIHALPVPALEPATGPRGSGLGARIARSLAAGFADAAGPATSAGTTVAPIPPSPGAADD